MVGPVRFELTTPCTPCKCATRLRYGPDREGAANRWPELFARGFSPFAAKAGVVALLPASLATAARIRSSLHRGHGIRREVTEAAVSLCELGLDLCALCVPIRFPPGALMAPRIPPHGKCSLHRRVTAIPCLLIQPGWRNWQTQRTQNPSPSKGVWVRPPLRAPSFARTQ
jgi:hypothetical protein